MIKKICCVVLFTCSWCGAFAVPASESSVKELLQVAKVKALVDGMGPQIDQMMKSAMFQAMGGKSLTPEDQKIADTMRTHVMKVMHEELNWDTLEPMYIKIYEDSFTQEEIDGILSFYKTPAGVALVNKMPLVMKNSMLAMQQKMGPLIQKMQAEVQQAAHEIQEQQSKKG